MSPVPLINHPCTMCRRPTSMWCSSCQSAWYCTPEHLQSDWQRHRKECVLATHSKNMNIIATLPALDEQQVIYVPAILFSPEEECPRIITIKCRPPQVPSQDMCPQPLVNGHFSDGQAESIVLTQGFNGEPLRFPLHLWYLPTALLPCPPKSHATSRHPSASNEEDPTIQEWDALSWQQVGEPSCWTGHANDINAIAIHPTGTPIDSASEDPHDLSDRQTIAIFPHPHLTDYITFAIDDRHTLCGGIDMKISERAVPKNALPEEVLNTPEQMAQGSDLRILSIDTPARNACIAGDLSTAEQILTQEINVDANKYASYANRSFVMARKHHWDHALQDANKSISIQPSLTGCISKGIALGGKGNIRDSIQAFDLAFTLANEDPKIIIFLLLLKAIVIFNAGQHEEAIIRVQELAATCQNDSFACHIVEAYIRIRLLIDALDGGRHNEAADHFTATIKMNILSSRSAIHSEYNDFVVLFGWDLTSLWVTANQKRWRALFRAGRLWEAIESCQHMTDVGDITTNADSLDWSTVCKQEFSALCAVNGDAAFSASEYDRAIDLYSVAIELDPASDTNFAKRSMAKSGKMLWVEALQDAQKVIELNPLSYRGYNLKHTALHGAQRYDEAIQACQIMISKLDDAADVPTQKLRQRYLSPSEAAHDIRKVIDTQLEDTPFRVLDTATGLLCDREAQISAFKSSIEYKELVSSTITHPDFRMKRINEMVATYFRYAMLSHRWEGKEPLLQDIQDKVLYELNPVGSMVKLQSFCKVAGRAGCRWAWSDTCCIDKSNSVEHQEAINSMFTWYEHSALTIIYLSDVPPSSKSGALANSAWSTRGWTAQELLASKVILFYQKDWTLYLDDRSPNHKESVAIMQELEYATGIDRQDIVAFRPGMKCARETLQWASTRVTTLQEDIAYSLSGVFGVRLRVDYGEKKQCALGRLLRKVVARSGDITALDWVGKPSEFNSCLPADITSYKTSPFKLPFLSEEDIQSSVSSLRDVVALKSASTLYHTLDELSAPRFTHRRLHLPCIVFPVTEVRRQPGQNEEHFTYRVKADGLRDLDIITEEKLPQFSRAIPPPAWRTFLLVRTWTRQLLELPDLVDDTGSVEDLSASESTLPPSENEPVHSEFHSRALRLIVRLGQPFSAFLLARQRDGEYKRIASDRNIIAQVKDMASVGDMMNIRTLEIM